MIDAAMGTNPYGEPIFRLAWGQSETMRGIDFSSYCDVLVTRNSPCWIVMMWEPPQIYGPDWLWYQQNRDEVTGLQFLGEYPYHGRYRPLHQMVHRQYVNGRLHSEYLELSSLMIESIIPMCRIWQDLSRETQVELLKRDMEIRDQEAARKAVEAKADCKPAFGGKPVSFTNQGCRTSLIAKKMEQLEKAWARAMEAGAHLQAIEKGFQQGALPTVC